MYSKIQLVKKYLRYLLTASNGKGHGMHSPFVFELITKILNDKRKYPFYDDIEQLRCRLKQDNRVLEIEDFGAGSRVNPTNKRKVSAIAKSALKPNKYSRLLFRMVQFYQPKSVLELGTCFGITTAYLAQGNKDAEVFTMEGAKEIAEVAKQGFQALGMENIELILGNMDNTLPEIISKFQNEHKTFDFVFVDGNHREEPTLRYFMQLLPVLNEHSILIFDDIHWSEEMQAAWHKIIANEKVTLSIDLFFVGLVFFRNENKVKQHFSIRF
jgi:predicted O-methyltransferase YrrM